MGASGRIKNRRTGRTMGRQLSSNGPDSKYTVRIGIHRLNHPKGIGVILVVIQLKACWVKGGIDKEGYENQW